MRLTLRTMLAYLDGILEPEDQRELSTKIDESEFATGLMHRIRQCSTRIRLGAPSVSGKDGGLDPNTVADYLDNTLPSERVPDFEKVCLESDIHLAEVAASHQILEMVLSEPARVDSQSRKRMYDLPAMLEKGSQDATAAETEAANNGDGPPTTSLPDKPTPRDKPQVPDYLRESQKRPTWMIVAGVLVAAVLVIFAWNKRDAIVAMFESPPTDQKSQPEQPVGQPKQPTTLAVPDRDKQQSDAARSVTSTDDRPNRVDPTEDVESLNRAPDLPATSLADPDSAAPEPDDVASDILRPDSNQDPPAAPDATDDDGPSVEPKLDETPAARPVATVVGRYMSEGEDVLLRFDHKTGQWGRLAPRTALSTNDRLLVLPAFRSKIVLGAGVALELGGGTIVELVTPPDESTAALRMLHGRLVNVMASRGTARLQLSLGDRNATALISDANTIIAVEHDVYRAIGTDPEKEPGKAVTDLYVVSGNIDWIEGDSMTPETIRAGHRRTWMSGTAGRLQLVESMPKWIEAEQALSMSEKRGAFDVTKHLQIGQPVSLGMKELINHRKGEVRSLAARCHGFVDQYKALVDAIGDEQLEWVYRVRYIDSLRASMMRSRMSATKVREALADKFGDQAGLDLYRMLYGYSPGQLKDNAAAQLVDRLSHDKLYYRVMAFYNLVAITGIPLNYKPEVSEIKRRQSTRRWSEKLKEGAVIYKIPPAAPDVEPLPNGRRARGLDAKTN